MKILKYKLLFLMNKNYIDTYGYPVKYSVLYNINLDYCHLIG